MDLADTKTSSDYGQSFEHPAVTPEQYAASEAVHRTGTAKPVIFLRRSTAGSPKDLMRST